MNANEVECLNHQNADCYDPYDATDEGENAFRYPEPEDEDDGRKRFQVRDEAPGL